MSTYEPQSTLESLLRACELGWMIDWYAPPDQALPFLRNALEQATLESRRRLGAQAPTFGEDVLGAEYKRNPHKIRAFLQVLGATRTPQILVMAWRILQGSDIAEVQLSYAARSRFQLRIVLSNPYDQASEEYESSDINDAAVLRHFGITTQEGAPLFHGLYPLRIS